MLPSYRLIGSKFCGSALVELMFQLTGLPLEVELIPFGEAGPQRDRLLALNPTGQVPTLMLPGGQVMTESAAIALYLHDLVPEAGLFPPPDHPARPAALRWLMVLNAQIYPTFTYGDEPNRWVMTEAAAALRQRTDEWRMGLWRTVEAQGAHQPYFLGATMSVLDLYVAVMSAWRPGRLWFAAHTPKLARIAERVAERAALRVVLERNGLLPDSAA